MKKIKKVGKCFLAMFMALSLFTFSGPSKVYAFTDQETNDFKYEASTGTLTVKTNAGTENWRNGSIFDDDIKTVFINDGVDTIRENAFSECNQLTTVTIPESVKTIEAYAFSGNSALEQITLPNKLESIGTCAFAFSGLKSIVIPGSVTTLGNKIFEENQNLESVTFNEGSTKIGKYMFYNCEKLENVNIPDTIKIIEMVALGGCSSLTEITLSSGLEQLGQGVFAGTGITSIILKGLTPPAIDNQAFDNLTAGYKITVPFGTEAAYASAWNGIVDAGDFKVAPGIEVAFSSLSANGTSNTETTTKLTLAFDKDIEGLSADDITLTGATKGTLTKLSETGKYELTISAITVKNDEEVTVVVNKPLYDIKPTIMKTKVYVKDTTVTPPSYGVITGANGVWKNNSTEGLQFKIDAKYADFKGIKIDGKDVDNTQYTSAEGSTVVTLKPEYLRKLFVGKHTLTVVFNDKDVAVEFTIEKVEGTTPDPEVKPEVKPTPDEKGTGKELDSNVPNTGVDTNNQVDFISVLIGATVILGVCGYRKKKLEK